jgi:hypothetical protein
LTITAGGNINPSTRNKVRIRFKIIRLTTPGEYKDTSLGPLSHNAPRPGWTYATGGQAARTPPLAGQRFLVYAAIQFHLDEAVDALKLDDHPFYAESHKRRQIERERLLPAVVKEAMVFDVIVVEII